MLAAWPGKSIVHLCGDFDPREACRSPVFARSIRHPDCKINGVRVLPRPSSLAVRWEDLQIAAMREPLDRSWAGDLTFLVFAVAQLLDGIFTYVGISMFGSGIEANPLIAWSMTMLGAGGALIAIKLMALGCGAVLHVQSMHRTVAALALVYLIGALWPWTRLLLSV